MTPPCSPGKTSQPLVVSSRGSCRGGPPIDAGRKTWPPIGEWSIGGGRCGQPPTSQDRLDEQLVSNNFYRFLPGPFLSSGLIVLSKNLFFFHLARTTATPEQWGERAPISSGPDMGPCVRKGMMCSDKCAVCRSRIVSQLSISVSERVFRRGRPPGKPGSASAVAACSVSCNSRAGKAFQMG